VTINQLRKQLRGDTIIELVKKLSGYFTFKSVSRNGVTIFPLEEESDLLLKGIFKKINDKIIPANEEIVLTNK
jgi:hypothetical protein